MGEGREKGRRRTLPFLTSCLIGASISTVAISIFAFVFLVISITAWKVVVDANKGTSCHADTGLSPEVMKRR